MSSSPLRNDSRSSKTDLEDFFTHIVTSTITTDKTNEDTISVTTASTMTNSPISSSSFSDTNNNNENEKLRTKNNYYGSFMGSLMHLASDSFDDGLSLDDSLRRQYELDQEEKATSPSPLSPSTTRKKAAASLVPWYAQYFSLSGTTIKGSNGAMWLGHVAFILGSLFYLKGAILDLQWTIYTNEHHIPTDIIDMDDDVTWIHWEKSTTTTTLSSSSSSSSSGPILLLDKVDRHDIDTTRQHYWTYSTLFECSGGAFFVLCGFADLMYYGEYVDLFMIVAGVAGVISAICDSSIMESRWNTLSCHMYLIEAYVMIRRHRKEIEDDGHYGERYEGYYIFLFSRICFFGGCIMDIITSYIELSTYESTFLDTYSDLTSCVLWVTCAFVDFGAEIYFYESEDDEDDDINEEVVETNEKRLLISV